MNQSIVVRVEIFREGEQYVGICPDLEVSSFGDSEEDAKRSLQEALEGFLEECETMGTLEEVFEEAGFTRQNGNWLPRQPLSAQLMTIGAPVS